MTQPAPDREESMPTAAPEQTAWQTASTVQEEGDDLVVRIPRTMVTRERVQRFLDLIELEHTTSGIDVPEEEGTEAAGEVRQAPWLADRPRAGGLMESSLRDKAIELMQQLPSDASIEEMMEKLYFLSKLERGLRQINTGQVVSHEEAKRRFAR